MAKLHSLVSPLGELTLRVHSDHTQITATSPLAVDWGLGWWHAHHSGDEATFARTFWRGELATGPRPTPAQVEIDAFIAPWKFSSDLSLETSRLPAGHRSRIQAYTQGFNHGRRRRQGETPWTPEDCHLLARTLGFLEWWETRLPQREFLHTAWQAGLSWAKVLDLWPDLGSEPNRDEAGRWDQVPGFSPEARLLVNQIRRFRPSPVWAIPGSRTTGGKALLGATFISDVTEPGLPFLAVSLESPAGNLRGLSRPGHPGLLSGWNGHLAWHACPGIDDTLAPEVHGGKPGGRWAGSGRTGTLEGLLALEDAPTVDQARTRTQGLGSACLDVAAVDDQGDAACWAQGPRWQRPAREAWIGSDATDRPVGPRAAPERSPEGPPRVTVAAIEERLIHQRGSFAEQALAPLRFLLPDTEPAQKLRRWTGLPGPELIDFERLYAAVLEEFWATSPVVPGFQSPVTQTLATAVDRLIQAPHSAWLPSQEKNRRLADAVRRGFAPGQPPAPPLLARRGPRPCWTEVQSIQPRIFAATTVVVVDTGCSDWKLFLTDDETEVPVFQRW